MNPFAQLPPFNPESGDLNAIIDTPKGSRNKCSWREKSGLFQLSDRLIAVTTNLSHHEKFRTLHDIGRQVLNDIEHFFISYNEAKGKKFGPLGRFGSKRARALVDKGQTASR